MNTKPILGYPAYRIDETGKLESCWGYKGVPGKRGVLRVLGQTWREINPGVDGKGYLCVGLCDGKNKPKSFRIHRLMALAFYGPSVSGNCVRHLDGNPANNHITNLAWGTYAENEEDKKLHGTWMERITHFTLKPDDVISIRKMAENGKKHAEIANIFNVSRPTITRVINRKIWRHI